jgi:AcrR family transcriptional regulator
MHAVPRMKPDVRRQAIVDAAQAVATRNGLSTTTVRDIADEMGTSSGLIHHYFTSMEELHAEVFSQVARTELRATHELISRADSPTGQLALYLAAFTDPENDENFHFWLDAWSEAARNLTIRAASRELNIEWQQLLATVIRAGVESGEFVDVDVEAVSWKTLSLLDGLELQIVAHPTVLTRQQAARWAAESIEADLGLRVGTIINLITTAPAQQ